MWIRDVVHVMRNDQGEVEALIGFMFDISERKKTEHQLLRLQKELEILSFKDGLTKIANRRRFDSSFEIEWERAQHSHKPLSLLLFDVDYFKQYNDLYGHLQGDQCLTRIAQTLSLAVDGHNDLVARYGGEEFAILLPNADANVARKVAERCQRLIQKQAIVHALSPYEHCMTVSIGAGCALPGQWAQATDFLHAIDQQLYSAKNQGRNQTVYMLQENYLHTFTE